MITIRNIKEFAEKPYWKNRWVSYLKDVAELTLKLNPKKVLEIGSFELPLCLESDTMDIIGEPTYFHDATNVPYPIPDKYYDLVISTQVWEHLGTGQREAFKEVKRISKAAIFTFPYLWKNPEDVIHFNIDKRKINFWTCEEPFVVERKVIGRRARILRMYQWKQ